MIKENIYLQYFCGLKEFTTKEVFDPSLFVDIRKRLGGEEFERFNCYIIEESEKLKPHQARVIVKSKSQGNNKSSNDTEAGEEFTGETLQSDNEKEPPKNRGTLKVDATVADQEIKYPNDVSLLNEARQHLERMIDYLYDESIDKKRP